MNYAMFIIQYLLKKCYLLENKSNEAKEIEHSVYFEVRITMDTLKN